MKTRNADALDDPELVQMLWETVRQQEKRDYATFRVFPDRSIAELGTVRDLLAAIKAEEGQHGFRSLKINQPDPPDCIGIDSRGECVGFEVTELVDETTIRQSQRGRSEWKEWGPEEFRAKLKTILEGKDQKKLLGGPYDRFVVVVHTDEPLLPHHECASMLADHRFGPFQQIDESFLIFSSEPGGSSDPYIQLKLR